VAEIDVQQAAEQHFARIHRAALLLTGNPWDADDLAQECFLVLSNQGQRFQHRSSLYTWLYGVLLNLERRNRRRKSVWHRKLRLLFSNDSAQPATVPAAHARVEVEEWKRSLWGFVAQLPDGQRQTLVLRYSEQLSYQEIAEVLECPLGTVKSRIHHGLATLRSLMSQQGGDLRNVPRHANEVLPDAI
jgi:RNA polymerase sigma-70 factor (ECF subfamily)